jgi:hypothetical protein
MAVELDTVTMESGYVFVFSQHLRFLGRAVGGSMQRDVSKEVMFLIHTIMLKDRPSTTIHYITALQKPTLLTFS